MAERPAIERRRIVSAEAGDSAGGNMSVREAGRKGGRATRARYGAEFFAVIGAKGGKAVSERYSTDHFREIGRKGGRRVAELIERAKALDPGLNGQGE